MHASPFAQPGAATHGTQSYICLDPNLGSDAAGPLRQMLLGVLPAGNSLATPPAVVRIDGSRVENLGAGVLQILLAISVELAACGSRLVIDRPSVRLREWTRLTGAPLSLEVDVVRPVDIEEL